MLIGTTFTNNGADRIGLTPTINIYNAETHALVVTGAPVDEIGEGGYEYDFTAYDPTKNYYWKIDGGAAIPNRERYKRGWSWFAGPIPDAQAGTNGGMATVNANNYIAGMQGTKNTLDDMTDITAAEINAEVVDALNVDTYAEPGQGAPPATTTLVNKIGYLFKFFRNKNTRNDSTIEIYNDAGNVVDHKALISDDNVTFIKGKYETGP